MRVLVCGGRDYQDKMMVSAVLSGRHHLDWFGIVITGGATGADALAKEWALWRGITVAECKANWDYFGKKAGPMRNTDMLGLEPHLVIAFPGGKGTKDMVDKAIKAGIRVIQVEHS